MSAAHATTTHLGLGANTAIKDVKDLFKTLKDIADDMQHHHKLSNKNNSIDTGVIAMDKVHIISQHISKYNQTMVKRAIYKVRGSTFMTGVLHATGWKATIRDYLLNSVRLYRRSRGVVIGSVIALAAAAILTAYKGNINSVLTKYTKHA